MATKAKRGWRPREETLATVEFKRAHAKAIEARKSSRCKHGHDLKNPENVHAGTLMRTGKIMCQKCWLGYAAKKSRKGEAHEGRKAVKKPVVKKPVVPPPAPPAPEVK
ncbi:MAG TPA: hypothetical protein VN810_12345 [Terriglobales bacterium]|nr:hypothetical protein [Terriglobales bacterium]